MVSFGKAILAILAILAIPSVLLAGTLCWEIESGVSSPPQQQASASSKKPSVLNQKTLDKYLHKRLQDLKLKRNRRFVDTIGDEFNLYFYTGQRFASDSKEFRRMYFTIVEVQRWLLYYVPGFLPERLDASLKQIELEAEMRLIELSKFDLDSLFQAQSIIPLYYQKEPVNSQLLVNLGVLARDLGYYSFWLFNARNLLSTPSIRAEIIKFLKVEHPK